MTILDDFLDSEKGKEFFDFLKQANQAYQEFDRVCINERKDCLHQGLTSLESYVRGKVEEYRRTFATYDSRDQGMSYLRSRRDHYQ